MGECVVLVRLFRAHPESVGESYVEHLGCAAGFGFKMVGAGLACIAHGLFPFMFKHTGSETVRNLHDTLSARRTLAASTACEDHARAA